MAIDTEAKRRSVAVAYGIETVGIIPDGDIDAADRAHARRLYAGLTYDSSATTAKRKWFGEDYYRTRYK